MTKSAVFLIAPLILVGALSSAILSYATPHGAGLYYDSLQYLSAADNLVAGQGLGRQTCNQFKPMVLFPPAYSIVLASGSLFGATAMQSAWLLNAILLPVDALLLAILVFRTGTRPWLAISCSILFATAAVTLSIFSWAMTEPLYVFLLLGSLITASMYLDTASPRWLLLLSMLLGLSVLTRYAGIGLVAAIGAAVALDPRWPIRWRARSAVILLFLASFPLALWLVRNFLLVEQATNRSLGFYYPDAMRIRELASTLMAWFLPSLPEVRARWSVVFGMAALAGFCLLWRSYQRAAGGQASAYHQTRLMLFAAMAHILVVAFYSTFLRPPIPLDNRILFPLFVALYGLLPTLWTTALSSRGPVSALALSVLFFALALQQLRALPPTINRLRQDGQGYASTRWQHSQTALALKADSPAIIYTNDVTAVYFTAGLPSCAIPTKGNFVGLADMRRSVSADSAVVVIFGDLSAEFMGLRELTYGMTQVGSFSDGAIYRAEGDAPEFREAGCGTTTNSLKPWKCARTFG